MITQKVTITNSQGLHIRTAGLLAREMTNFKCSVYIIFKDSKINAKSILSVAGACIKCGSKITIECNGIDEQQAMERAIELIESDLS